MRTIAERAIFGVFAGAEKRFFIGVGCPCERRKFSAFVGAIAEGLVLRLAACAPIIGFAGFNVDGERGFASNVRSCHEEVPY